jgi:hypothetical protein
MATAIQLFTARDAAGADYAAALAALRNAWIALKAHDIACGNANVLNAHPSGGALTPVASFNHPSQWWLHPVFGSQQSPSDVWPIEAQSAARQLINSLS